MGSGVEGRRGGRGERVPVPRLENAEARRKGYGRLGRGTSRRVDHLLSSAHSLIRAFGHSDSNLFIDARYLILLIRLSTGFVGWTEDS